MHVGPRAVPAENAHRVVIGLEGVTMNAANGRPAAMAFRQTIIGALLCGDDPAGKNPAREGATRSVVTGINLETHGGETLRRETHRSGWGG